MMGEVVILTSRGREVILMSLPQPPDDYVVRTTETTRQEYHRAGSDEQNRPIYRLKEA